MTHKTLTRILILLAAITPFLLKEGLSASGYKGERIIYEITPVGRAEYKDLGTVELQGKMVNLITFRTQVLGFVDTEKIYSDPETLLPLLVERDITMLTGKEYLTEVYRPGDCALTITKYKNKKKVEEYNYREEGPLHNAILLPFQLRNIPNLDIGWSMEIRLPDKFVVKLVGIEEVSVLAGDFIAYHFTSTPKKFEIWITKDEPRVPVKIKGLGIFGYTLLMSGHYLK